MIFARTAIASLAFIGPVATAQAADIPLKAPPPAPILLPWSGFYFGAHAGYGWSEKQFLDPVPGGGLGATTHPRGALGGLQAGYNYQVNQLVLGIEGDVTWSDMKSNFSCFSFGDQICSARPNWLATVTGRIGYAAGPALFYVKGGVAFTRDELTNLATCAGGQPLGILCNESFLGADVRAGWTAGVGIEYLMTRNWSVKFEYNYMDFGRRSVVFQSDEGNLFSENIRQKVNVVKVGLNYHLDWDAAAPAAAAWAYAPGGKVKSRKVKNNNNNNNNNNDDDEPEQHMTGSLIFDVSKWSYNTAVDALIAPFTDIESSGLRIMLLGGAGLFKYPAEPGSEIKGAYSEGDALIGYSFQGNNYAINLLAGANAQNYMLSRPEPENKVQGTAFGVKVHGDAWVNPTPQILTYADAEYSTAFKTYHVKLKVGRDILNGNDAEKAIFIGPEVVAFGDARFDQWRIGAHITQMKFGKVTVDVSAGFAHDSSVGKGAYTTVEFARQF